MRLTSNEKVALGTALNEATLLGVEVDEGDRAVAVTFSVLTLPESGPAPDDCRVQFLFSSVDRIAASLRNGTWDDADAEVVPFPISDLAAVVRGFGGEFVYGWEFFDIHDTELRGWGKRLSLDWTGDDNGRNHSISLFQEDGERHLDLCIWFGSFEIQTPSGDLVPLSEFCEGGRRWWDALYRDDPRTEGHGIVPA